MALSACEDYGTLRESWPNTSVFKDGPQWSFPSEGLFLIRCYNLEFPTPV